MNPTSLKMSPFVVHFHLTGVDTGKQNRKLVRMMNRRQRRIRKLFLKEYMKKNGDAPKIVEIGCGTGAGANLITREIIPNAHYVAIDMQKAAIDTCARTTQPALPQRLLPLALRRALLPAASPVAARLG